MAAIERGRQASKQVSDGHLISAMSNKQSSFFVPAQIYGILFRLTQAKRDQ